MDYAKSLACQIKKKLPNHVDIDDLISQAYLGLVESAISYKEKDGCFKTWSYKRIRGAILDFLRKQKNSSEINDNFEAKNTNDYEMLDFLEKKTGKREADMVIMYHLQGFSLKDIASKYNISDVRVCQVMSKTKNKLKEMLAA